MEKVDKKITYVIIGVLVVAVIGLAIAFSVLSSQLEVGFDSNNALTQNALVWDVHFVSGAVTVHSAGPADATGRHCGNASVSVDNVLSVTIESTQLSKPGDKCSWDLVVENSGSIDAVLQGINKNRPTNLNSGDCTIESNSMTCGNIKYSLYTDSSHTSPLSTGTMLYKSTENGHTQNVYLVAEYLSDASLSGSAVTQNSPSFELVYRQK